MALTQPAVSLQIRQLEELVGQPLFEYVGKKLYLTDAAEALLKTSTDLFQRLESLDMQLSDLKGSLQGQLRLAVESSAKYITPHLFKAFQNLHPEVSLSLTVVNRTQVIKRLADNRDDLVIMSLVPQDMALEFLPFLNNPIIAVAPPDHPLCNAAKLALKDLEPFPLLVREPGSGTRKACEEFFQQRRAHFADPGDRLAGVPARRGDRRPRPGPAAAPCGAPGTGQRPAARTTGGGIAALSQLVPGARQGQAPEPGGPGVRRLRPRGAGADQPARWALRRPWRFELR